MSYINREQLIRAVRHEMDMQDLYLPAHFLDIVNDCPAVDTESSRIVDEYNALVRENNALRAENEQLRNDKAALLSANMEGLDLNDICEFCKHNKEAIKRECYNLEDYVCGEDHDFCEECPCRTCVNDSNWEALGTHTIVNQNGENNIRIENCGNLTINL